MSHQIITDLPTEPETGMQKLDAVLELLQDSEWHSRDEIGVVFGLSDTEVAAILDCFVKSGLVVLNPYGGIKIEKLGLGFLELPVEEIDDEN